MKGMNSIVYIYSETLGKTIPFGFSIIGRFGNLPPVETVFLWSDHDNRYVNADTDITFTLEDFYHLPDDRKTNESLGVTYWIDRIKE